MPTVSIWNVYAGGWGIPVPPLCTRNLRSTSGITDTVSGLHSWEVPDRKWCHQFSSVPVLSRWQIFTGGGGIRVYVLSCRDVLDWHRGHAISRMFRVFGWDILHRGSRLLPLCLCYLLNLRNRPILHPGLYQCLRHKMHQLSLLHQYYPLVQQWVYRDLQWDLCTL